MLTFRLNSLNKGEAGEILFYLFIFSVLPTDDDVGNTSNANNIVKFHNQIVVQMYEQFIHRAEVQSPYGNTIGYLDRYTRQCVLHLVLLKT